MFDKSELSTIVFALVTLVGCGGVHPVTGGTFGELHFGGDPLGDVQITIHQVEGSSYETIGFAATKADGSFELVTPGAKGPLHLSPGEYCCTLESVGAPIVIPREYMQAETTPLKVSWQSGDSHLDLDFKPAKIIR